MQIRKFEGGSMDEVLQNVRHSVGPEAVVISTREVRKRGVLGMFADPTVEVMVAVDAEEVVSGGAPSHARAGEERAAARPHVESHVRNGFESLLEEMAQPDTRNVAIDSLYEELREIRESIGALRLRLVSQASQREGGDLPLYEELRAIKESLGALRVKLASQPGRPEDVSLHEALQALQESVGGMRVKMTAISAPAKEIYDTLEGLLASMRALEKKEVMRRVDLAADSPVYEAFRTLRESVLTLKSLPALSDQPPRERPLTLPSDSPVYQELRAIRTSLAALPAREIVEIKGSETSAANGPLIYDALGALQVSVRALREQVEAMPVDALREGLYQLKAQASEGLGQEVPVTPALDAIRGSVHASARQMMQVAETSGVLRDLLGESIQQGKTQTEVLYAELQSMRKIMAETQSQSLSAILQVADEMKRMQATLSTLSAKESSPTSLPIEVYEELKSLKGALGTLQSSMVEMAQSRAAGIEAAQDEVRDIRRTMTIQQYRADLTTLRPILAGLFDQILANGVEEDGAIALFRAMRARLSYDNLWKDDQVQSALREAISESVTVTGPLPVDDTVTRLVFLVGPSGAGKSMTAAKLAARWSASDRGRVTVIALDATSPAEIAPLSGFLQSAGLSLSVGIAESALQQAVALRTSGEIILIEAQDSAINSEKIAALAALSAVSVTVYYVLPAYAEQVEMERMITACPLAIDALLLTHLDEAKRFGQIYNLSRKHHWPIAYLATGVRIPEDLEVATPGRLAELVIDRQLKMDLTEGLVAAPTSTSTPGPRVIAVTSGKGGVGKTNVVANLAMVFSNMGKRVLVIDADLGLGNLDVLFGVVPQYTLEHVLAGQKSITEVLVKGPGNIHILPTASGASHLGELSSTQKQMLLGALDRLEGHADIFLVDTGAGIGSTVLYFNTAAQDIILVVTPEPTSLADAYAMMKTLSRQYGEKHFNVIVNMVKAEAEAQEVVRKLSLVGEQFLGVTLEPLGSIAFDDYLKMSVCKQKTVVELYPSARSSVQFAQIGSRILRGSTDGAPRRNVQFLWRRMLSNMGALSPAERGR